MQRGAAHEGWAGQYSLLHQRRALWPSNSADAAAVLGCIRAGDEPVYANEPVCCERPVFRGGC